MDPITITATDLEAAVITAHRVLGQHPDIRQDHPSSCHLIDRTHDELAHRARLAARRDGAPCAIICYQGDEIARYA
ncbi:MAG: hypothetical protein ACOCYN_03830 [Planctomycetota bacterium]